MPTTRVPCSCAPTYDRCRRPTAACVDCPACRFDPSAAFKTRRERDLDRDDDRRRRAEDGWPVLGETDY